MQVKYMELPKQFKDERLWAVVREQLELTHFVGGEVIEVFEKNLAALCGTPYALGLNSGTDALFLGLVALGVGRGDEVITAPNSFISTAGAAVAVGAKPVFVDVGPDYNMDVSKIEPAITPRTKAIIAVHLTGNPADMPAILPIARKYKLAVLEDAAQAVCASIGSQQAGSFGDLGCFSLHPLKNLNVAGDGGAVTMNSEQLYLKIKQLRNHGLKNRDELDFFGYNSRLDSIQAAIANYGLKSLEDVVRKHIHNAALYDSLLADLDGCVTVPPRRADVKQVYHTYIVQVADREKLIAFLAQNGIETKVHYPIPLHLQRPALEMGYKRGDFPVCEAQSRRILTLPVHRFLADEQIEYVAAMIKKFYGKA
ncbi:MAG: DegT/DnrJ/EryC1/StrS family aminotransferase [Planctomycetota bacterium]